MARKVIISKILYRSKRGLLELDLVLEKFIEKYLSNLNDENLALLLELMDSEDNDLLDSINGHSFCLDEKFQPMVRLIRDAHKNTN